MMKEETETGKEMKEKGGKGEREREKRERSNLHWIHDSNPGPLSSFSINLVTHDGSSKMMCVNAECKRVKGKNAILNITMCVPEF
jgi:hypothetical protein